MGGDANGRQSGTVFPSRSSGDGTSMTAKVRGDNIILTGSSREMTREQVEAEFASELGGRQTSEQR